CRIQDPTEPQQFPSFSVRGPYHKQGSSWAIPLFAEETLTRSRRTSRSRLWWGTSITTGTILDGSLVTNLTLVTFLPGIPELGSFLPIAGFGNRQLDLRMEHLVHHVDLTGLGRCNIVVALLDVLVFQLLQNAQSDLLTQQIGQHRNALREFLLLLVVVQVDDLLFRALFGQRFARGDQADVID